MATNLRDTRPVDRVGDTVVTDPAATTVVNPTGVGGVAVYDRDVDRTVDRTTSPTLRPSTSIMSDPAPVATRTGGSVLSWIVGAIVLVVLAYFLLQIIF